MSKSDDIFESAMRMRREMEEIAARYPQADLDNVRHTMELLEELPIERLRNALRRARARTAQ